ncbi:MAG: LON peptidase substrate-binding domain-containing protein [Salibacteraceae bacterium]
MSSVTELLLPLFPLGVVVLPGEEIQLHIFEPRYKQLIQDCREQESTFGIPFVKSGAIRGYGTNVRLLSVDNTYATGEMDITVVGVEPLHVEAFYPEFPDKLYPGGKVVLRPTDSEASDEFRDLFAAFDEAFLGSEPWKSLTYRSTYEIANKLNLSTEQKYKLISLGNTDAREAYLTNVMKYLLVLQEQENAVEDGFYLS